MRKRKTYLSQLEILIQLGFEPVYTDESYAYQNHMYNYSWVSPNSSTAYKFKLYYKTYFNSRKIVEEDDLDNATPGGKGKRLIIIGAGWREGELVDARLVPIPSFIFNFILIFNLIILFQHYWSDEKLADYHGNVDWLIYYKWFTEKLVPSLSSVGKPVVVIMDNASYHSCKSTSTNWVWPNGRNLNNAKKVNYVYSFSRIRLTILPRSISFPT